MATTPLLQVTGLQKSYNVPVLIDFNFELRHGEVHALVGSNGAGKSTFARILSGLTQANGGTIRFDPNPKMGSTGDPPVPSGHWPDGMKATSILKTDAKKKSNPSPLPSGESPLGTGGSHVLPIQTFAPTSKREAEHAGIIMVLQELNVIGTLSIAENIFLNRLPRRAGFVCFNELHEKARHALGRVGLGKLDPAMPASQLGVGQQQLVEIAGALSQNCRLLILDEPTAALTDPETEQLFENIRQLQKEGVGIIYVSHRMDEIRRIADRITVLRDGRHVATHNAKEVTPAELIREMAGHDFPERKNAGDRSKKEVAMRVENLCAGERVRDVSFSVRRGEILGLAGLIGSGRTEILRAIFGADRRESGEIFLDDQPIRIKKPKDAIRAGIGLVPEDRKQDGLLLPQPIRVNTTLGTMPRHANRFSWIDSAAEINTSDYFCDQLQVRRASIEQKVGELSGGNQQKVVIARWLAQNCNVLLFDEPTRGIDVAAKDTIYQLLRDLAAAGKAIVVVSSELVELMLLCDRILVMSQGRITGEFTPGDWSQEKITQAAFSGYLDK